MCRNPLDASRELLTGRQRHWLPQHREGEIFRRSRLRRRRGCRTPLGSNDDGQKAGNLLRGGAVAGVRLPGLFELLDITIGAARGDDDFRRHPCSVTHLVTKDDCGYHYDEFLPNNCAAVSASSRSHLSELRPRRIRKSFAGSRDSWTTRHQGRGRCTGISGSSPGPSARSSPSRPGPKAVAVPVYPDA